MIHDEIVTFEVARLAKEKGFPQDVFGSYEMTSSCYLEDGRYYKDGCICPIEDAYTAPTQSLLQRWLREEKKIHINISAAYSWDIERTDGNILLPHNNLDYICTHLRSSNVTWEDNYGCFSTYELALEDALAYSLKNLV